MIRVDDEFMAEVGLEVMPETEKKAFMEYAEEELEVRVGQEISSGMTDEQLEEFSLMTDEAEAADWLEENAPNFRDVVYRVFEEFKGEIREHKAEYL